LDLHRAGVELIMATFIVSIVTPTPSKPATRDDDVRERAAIQQALLQIVGAVSNRAAYEGSITGGSAEAEFSYHCDERNAA
jgi:hypothetical protein